MDVALRLDPGFELLLLFIAGMFAGAGITLLVLISPELPRAWRNILRRLRMRHAYRRTN